MKLIFGSIFGILGVVFLMVGCPFLAVAGGLYYFVDYSTQGWVLVDGKVTGMVAREAYDTDTGYSTRYCPEVEFTTTAGQTLDLQLDECASPPDYQTGEAVQIYYDPQEPHHVQLKGGVQQSVGNIFIIVLGILGGVFSFIGLGLLLGVGVVLVRGRKTGK
jgi:hypothetical protein